MPARPRLSLCRSDIAAHFDFTIKMPDARHCRRDCKKRRRRLLRHLKQMPSVDIASSA